MGGLIAFEVAQQLRRKEREVGLLVLIDTGPPRTLRSVVDNHFVKSQSIDRSGHTGVRLKDSVASIRWTVRDRLLKKIRKLTCETFHQLRISLPPSLQAFYVDQVVYGEIYAKAHRQYIPQPYSGRAVYLKSEDIRERVSGWESLMKEGLEVRQVRGNHLSMLVEPNVEILAGALKECLSDAQRNLRGMS